MSDDLVEEGRPLACESGWPDEMYLGLMNAALRNLSDGKGEAQ